MSTKSVLVNFNGYPSTIDSLIPDNGLANLAGSLLHNGHETLVLDFCSVDIIRRLIPRIISKELNNVYDKVLMDIQSSGQLKSETINQLRAFDKILEDHKQSELRVISNEIIANARSIEADFIGFKLWTGDGFAGSVRIAEHIKKAMPKIRLFAGGPHVDWFMQSIFDYTSVFDTLCYGEGEETIVLLAEYVEGKRELADIPNILYRQSGSVKVNRQKLISDLDSLPDPVYDKSIYPAMEDEKKIKLLMVDESRGCPNSCYFCIHPRKSGHRWRKRDPIMTVNLIEKLGQQVDTNAFRLAGSNTPSDLRRKIAQELIDRRLGINYAAFGHVCEINHDDYKLLHDSGCVSLSFGVESGSQKILDQDINKKAKVSQIVSALKECKRSGIYTVASIIVPCPHDTPETIRETTNMLIETHPDSVTMQLPGVIPGTCWYENADRFGFNIDGDYMLKSMLYRIKLLMPPVLWDSFPYKINGMTHFESVSIAQNMAIELEKNGIITGIGDFLMLIGKTLGISPKDLSHSNRRLFFAGEYDKIQYMVRSFNDQVKLINTYDGVAGE